MSVLLFPPHFMYKQSFCSSYLILYLDNEKLLKVLKQNSPVNVFDVINIRAYPLELLLMAKTCHDEQKHLDHGFDWNKKTLLFEKWC